MSTKPKNDLAALVEGFRQDTGYPTEEDEEQKRLREEWREKLLPENIETLSRHDLECVACNGVWALPRYVYAGSLGTASVIAIRQLDDKAFSEALGHLKNLCWGDEPWNRYDEITAKPRKVPRVAEDTSSRLLAICHPDRFLPIGVQKGQYGREEMMQRLNLSLPQSGTGGQRLIDANDRLRDHIASHLDDDPHAIASFLYWLLEQDEQPEPPANGPQPGSRNLTDLSKDLLIDVGFLQDIVDLLKDKGQVILYGPPGTGKTYLARELAKVLAPEESCWSLVQFHPSTSYEDFFEGYRPAGTGDGGIRYELTPGPLARMAERASEAPEQRHIMVIDEINRGNLPRVLGELLFLLEYRDERVQTLYRPDTPFTLPANLWFIGTMNTADRSIALVDAALRRRFHFMPFFPDRYPIEGLLGRWLELGNQPKWVGHLVDAVNGELAKDLEGSHLLLGPSHFMKDFGSTPGEQRERLRRIWEYNIEPFIEDQFFGAPDRIAFYRFENVLKRHGPTPQIGAGENEGGAEVHSKGQGNEPGAAETDDGNPDAAGAGGDAGSP